jgi:hypothetical protein
MRDMKPTETPAVQPQPRPAHDAPTPATSARANARDAFPFATHDVLFAFALARSAKEGE